MRIRISLQQKDNSIVEDKFVESTASFFEIYELGSVPFDVPASVHTAKLLVRGSMLFAGFSADHVHVMLSKESAYQLLLPKERNPQAQTDGSAPSVPNPEQSHSGGAQ